MKFLDLFSGIGGFSLGLEAAGMETAAFCEYDEKARKVLKKNWPDVPIFNDIRTLNKELLDEWGISDIRLICGGYPCQPFSLAGERRGAEDDRHLWPEMFRLVQELRPDWVIGENVAGHVTMGIDQVLADLENEGYTARPFIIPACAVDAPHRRDRVWVVAYDDNQTKNVGNTENKRRDFWKNIERERTTSKQKQQSGVRGQFGRSGEDVADSNVTQCQRNSSTIRTQTEYSDFGSPSRWKPEPSVGRVAHGVPNRTHRLKQLGNAVVPQVVQVIGESIMLIEEMK